MLTHEYTNVASGRKARFSASSYERGRSSDRRWLWMSIGVICSRSKKPTNHIHFGKVIEGAKEKEREREREEGMCFRFCVEWS